MRDGTILRRAEFDPRLKTYWFVSTAIALVASCVGILALPVWLVLGQRLIQRRFDALGCDLSTRALVVRSGYLFHVEKTVPLEQITDLALHEGPILRRLGLAAIHIETAGQNVGGANAQLVGVVDAMGFRDAVLLQRDRVTERELAEPPAHPSQATVLTEVRDALLRIEQLLERRA